jgi:hypothetical protein
MAKGYIDELKFQLTLDVPDRYVVMNAKSRLKEWKRYYLQMEKDAACDLWSSPFFCALHKEFTEIYRSLKSRKMIEEDFIPKKKRKRL